MPAVMNLLDQINRVANRSKMSDIEKMHEPVIACPDSVKANLAFDCTVHVGSRLEHPNEPEHHVEFVDLYLDDLFLCRVDLAAKRSNPKVTFSVMLPRSGVLKAYECCNIHGVWASDKEIQVT